MSKPMQCMVFIILHNVWGSINPSDTIHHNDRLRTFGIVMSICDNRYMNQRLDENFSARHHVDDPSFPPQQIYQNIVFAFNNEKVTVNFPEDAYDVEGIDDLDCNIVSLMRITRDCKLIPVIFYSH